MSSWKTMALIENLSNDDEDRKNVAKNKYASLQTFPRQFGPI